MNIQVTQASENEQKRSEAAPGGTCLEAAWRF